MKVAAFTGASGAGKTTLLCAAITQYAARGIRVAAIKHTHHPLNAERRGDTARLAAAGADPVLLAGDREAVVFRRDTAPWRINYAEPADLLRSVDGAEVVLVEGFKQYAGWPRIDVRQEGRPSVAAILLTLEEAWRS
jgi:molybdopterin-guanine dinucleotide biosynthesis protein MobB